MIWELNMSLQKGYEYGDVSKPSNYKEGTKKEER
jgi:hypothetical protein